MKYSLYALLGFTVVCLFIFMFVASFLIYFTSPDSSSEHLQYFGQVGDFFGGMLNPILAFASFIALLYTIRIQSEELRLTREEFQKSVVAQKEMVKETRDNGRRQVLIEEYRYIANELRKECDAIEAMLHQVVTIERARKGDLRRCPQSLAALLKIVKFEVEPIMGGKVDPNLKIDSCREWFNDNFNANSEILHQHIRGFHFSVFDLKKTEYVYSNICANHNLDLNPYGSQSLDNARIGKIYASASILASLIPSHKPQVFYPVEDTILFESFRQLMDDFGFPIIQRLNKTS